MRLTAYAAADFTRYRAKMYQHGIDEEFLKEIGHITVSFSLLEDILRIFIIALLNESQVVGKAITAEVSFRGLKALAVTLFKEKVGENEDFVTLKKIIKKLNAIEKKRNQITHSTWGTEDQNPAMVTRIKDTAKANHGFKCLFEEYTTDDLHKVGESMLQLAGEIQALQDMLIEKKKIDNPYEG